MDTPTIVAICVLAAFYVIGLVTPQLPLTKPPSRDVMTLVRVIYVFFAGFIVFAFWGETMVAIFGLPEINYWQAVALVVLRSYLLPSGKIASYRHELQEYALRKANEK